MNSSQLPNFHFRQFPLYYYVVKTVLICTLPMIILYLNSSEFQFLDLYISIVDLHCDNLNPKQPSRHHVRFQAQAVLLLFPLKL